MSFPLLVGGSVDSVGFIEPLIHPDDDQLLAFLERYREKSGNFGVDLIDPPAEGPRKIEVQADRLDGEVMFLMIMAVFADVDDLDPEIKTSTNMEAPNGMVAFYGNTWGRRDIVRFDTMKAIIMEFAQTGTVSADLMW